MRLAHWFGMVLAAAAPLAAAAGTTCITDVMVVGGSSSSVTNSYASQGWKVIPQDLNAGAKGDYIYLLYKSADSASVSNGFITGFYIKTGPVTNELVYAGRAYHLAPYAGGAVFVDGKGDLNSNTEKQGDVIHLYYTKSALPGNRVVTGITFNGTQSGAVGKNGGTTGYDLNSGAKGDYIYMHVTTGELPYAPGVSYLDPTDPENPGKVRYGCTLMSGQTTLSSGWYVVAGAVTNDSRVTVSGDVNLILTDGAELAANGGVNVDVDNNITNSLTIWAQSTNAVAGKLTARGGTNQAGIGGGDGGSCGAVTINGGTVEAHGGYEGAGIGGGFDGAGGAVTVNGGEVTARGGPEGAGIGGGWNGAGGAVTVNGGTVVAQGDEYGAGIGGGLDGAGGMVTVNGGEVTAQGGSYGAGIGGGFDGAGGMVTVNGGEVTAQGGSYGAGIGGGDGGAGGKVTINGGEVTARGGVNGAGIGGGDGGGDGSLSIDGMRVGYVEADGKVHEWAECGDRDGCCRNRESKTVRIKVCSTHVFEGGICKICGEKAHYLDPTDPAHPEKVCQDFTVMTSQTTLTSGWYVVAGAVTNGNRIYVSGDVNLILTDGAELAANSGITVDWENRLTIWAQSTNAVAGKLTARGGTNQAGIGGGDGGSCGAVTINGGTVEAHGVYEGAGIGGGDGGAGGEVTINGGKVTAEGGKYGAGIGGGAGGAGGEVTINGGTVTAQGGNYGAGIGGGEEGAGGEVTINGGKVTAQGGTRGAGIGGGENGGGDGTLSIDGMKVGYVDGSGNVDSWAASGDRDGCCRNRDGKTVRIEVCSTHVFEGATCKICGDKAHYLDPTDPDNPEKVCHDFTVITDQTTLTSGWYVVAGAVTNGSRIYVSGDVNLILTDGAELAANSGITVDLENRLTIWAQSDGANMGKLTANGGSFDAGIGGYGGAGGTVTVNGGKVTATGGFDAAGIGGGNGGSGGNVTVNGGKVTAQGGSCGAGIGGGCNGDGGTVMVNGGEVTAQGGSSGAGIGGGWDGGGGVVTVNGGEVTAQGVTGGAGIGGGLDYPGGKVTVNGGKVTVNGGKVTAKSGSGGAGIGGGYQGAGGTVTVNGGEVTATGDNGGAGIGGGLEGAGGEVTVNGGSVTAKSASGAAAIGAGRDVTNDGSLSIDGMRVGYVDGNGNVDSWAECGDREDCCRNRESKTVRIEVCDPHVDDDASALCDFCGNLLALTIDAGVYFKATLSELGYDVPTNGTPYTVASLGLPAGLKLVSNKAVTKKVKVKGKWKTVVEKAAKSEWWIEGVPTTALDFATNPPYLVITTNRVTQTVPLSLGVSAQKVKELPDLALGQPVNEQFYLPGVTSSVWKVSGLPAGLKYTAKLLTTTKKKGKKVVSVTTNALPYSVYGKTTKAGLFTITAKRKEGGFYETMKYRVLVLPKAPDTALFGDSLTNITTMAYVPLNWNLETGVAVPSVPSVPFVPSATGGVKVAKVTGLPSGVTFAVANTYYDKKKKKLKQAAQTIEGTPTKPGTYVVTFTKNVTTGTGKKKKTVAKTAQILWKIVANDAEVELGFNTLGGVVESGLVGFKYGDMLAFEATSNATVKASGLPKGIKLVRLEEGGSRPVATGSGTDATGRVPPVWWGFEGFTAKAGTYLVTVTATLNGKSVTQRLALKVDGLPAHAKGSFYGKTFTSPINVTGSNFSLNMTNVVGLSTMGVTSAGKISGKFQVYGTNWTFSANSYAWMDEWHVEDHIIKRNEAFGTLATARYTYKERVKVKGKWKTVTRTLTKTLEVNVDGSGVLVHDPVDGVSAYLHQDLWGSTYKKVGQKVFVTGKKKYKVYQSTVDVGGKSCPLTVKVTTAGKATVTLKWNTGKKKNGKWVYYTPSCSTVVYPTGGSTVDPENFTGEVNYYFAPSPANNFPGVGGTVGVGVGY